MTGALLPAEEVNTDVTAAQAGSQTTKAQTAQELPNIAAMRTPPAQRLGCFLNEVELFRE